MAHVLYKKRLPIMLAGFVYFILIVVITTLLLYSEEAEEFGDCNGSAVLEEDITTVEVPSAFSPLQPHEVDVVRSFIDPMSECEDFGVCLYAATKQFVQEVLSLNNSS